MNGTLDLATGKCLCPLMPCWTLPGILINKNWLKTVDLASSHLFVLPQVSYKKMKRKAIVPSPSLVLTDAEKLVLSDWAVCLSIHLKSKISGGQSVEASLFSFCFVGWLFSWLHLDRCKRAPQNSIHICL